MAWIPWRARPTVLAVLFATAAWPIVALTFGAIDPVRTTGPSPVPASALAQWSAAFGGVMAPALVAGSIGGVAARRHAILGGVLTFVLALFVAEVAVLFLPAWLGENVGFHCLAGAAPGGPQCDVAYTSTRLPATVGDLPSLGLVLPLVPVIEPIPTLLLAVGVGIWTPALRAWDRASGRSD
jgi:hypothetical protein